MDTIPIFPGRTEVTLITPQAAPELKSVTFTDGSTKSWTTAATPGKYRAIYSNVSKEELEQVKGFYADHRLPDFWRCLAPDIELENCYFPERHGFPKEKADANGGSVVELNFFVRYHAESSPTKKAAPPKKTGRA